MAALIVAFALVSSGPVVTSAAVASVPATGEECFVEVVEANNKLVGSFEVISGGLLDVEATVSTFLSNSFGRV